MCIMPSANPTHQTLEAGCSAFGLPDGWDKSCSATCEGSPGHRRFELRTSTYLRGDFPPGRAREVFETGTDSWIETGNTHFDALYSMAIREAHEDSVSEISDPEYANGEPLQLTAFETGRLWHYVWTRDLAYAADLALARFDPARTESSLFFKTSDFKSSLSADRTAQILQDTGTGGSYPVSTDRVAWAIGARRLAAELADPRDFISRAYPILRATLLHDRKLVHDPSDGLYRGETSFLDWRRQTYPDWTGTDVLAIAQSKALSTNLLHYAAMLTAAEFADFLGRDSEASDWKAWAEELKKSVLKELFADGTPSAFLLAGDTSRIAVRRRDLLGECLAVHLGVVEGDAAKALVASYPLGTFGPAVVWPQSPTAPIYHNAGIWPFVTGYYTRSAAMTGFAAGVQAGLRSLARGAAMNLSNMENLDWAHGLCWTKYEGLEGPAINSQRQLWSVAAYMSAIQDVVFGVKAGNDGITLNPCVTPAIRAEFFPGAPDIHLKNLLVKGSRHDVTLHFPGERCDAYGTPSITLNGRPAEAGSLSPTGVTNRWHVHFTAAARQGEPAPLLVSADSGKHAIFGPPVPEWIGEGVVLRDGRAELHFCCAESDALSFEIYRDGQLAASGIRETKWSDPAPVSGRFAEYALAAVYDDTGTQSHLSVSRRAVPSNSVVATPLAPDQTEALITAPETGTWLIKCWYANDAGDRETGITCGIKRIEVADESGSVRHAAHVVFPHTGGSNEFRWSSPVILELEAGRYRVRLSEDDIGMNMSYFEKNTRLTRFRGGGPEPYNKVEIRRLELSPIALG